MANKEELSFFPGTQLISKSCYTLCGFRLTAKKVASGASGGVGARQEVDMPYKYNGQSCDD